MKLQGRSRIDGRFILISLIALFALAALVVYLFVPAPTPAVTQKLPTQLHRPISSNHDEQLAIKEILVEYVHSMLFEESNTYKTLFTSEFEKNNANNEPVLPKATSVQISQPVISFTSPNDARIRFNQIIRTSNNSHHSQERLQLKRSSTTGWRIDKRTSQPIMNSNSRMKSVSDEYDTFLYIKSEKEKQQDTKTIKKLIQFWADTRAEADVDGVATIYRQDIWERKGITKEQWLNKFQDPRIVTITNVNVIFPGQNQAEVSLNEQIADESKQAYFDVHLTLQLSDNGWLISDENSTIVSEQILQPVVTPRGGSIVKTEPISEPKPILDTAPIATTGSTSAAMTENASLDTVKAPGTESSIPLDTRAIKSLVSQWKQAWSNKDIDAYLGYYSEKFVPNSGATIEQWRRNRRSRLAKPKTIDIRVRDIEINQQSNTEADVTFTQIYKSNLFQDQIKKTLFLIKERNEWKIISENTRLPTRPSS